MYNGTFGHYIGWPHDGAMGPSSTWPASSRRFCLPWWHFCPINGPLTPKVLCFVWSLLPSSLPFTRCILDMHNHMYTYTPTHRTHRCNSHRPHTPNRLYMQLHTYTDHTHITTKCVPHISYRLHTCNYTYTHTTQLATHTILTPHIPEGLGEGS